MTKEIKNMSASVRARLINQAREKGWPFQQILLYYGMERFLYRLSQSNFQDQFVLKGGLYFVMHNIPARRFTRDIDLLGYTELSEDELQIVISNICAQDVTPDGIVFDPTPAQIESIRAPVDQAGTRIKFTGTLGAAKIHMQLDLGYRDEIYLEPTRMRYPTLLDMDPPVIYSYPPESIIAEKFQAMIFLGEVNSRMKDFYDIWLISKHYDFDGYKLQKSIRQTFHNRNTEWPTSSPTAFQESFIKNNQARWKHFVSTMPDRYAIPEDFSSIIEDIKVFMMPILEAADGDKIFEKEWETDAGWIELS